MTERIETIEIDECAIDVYTDKLADMGVPTPDVPYEAHIALSLLTDMAKSHASAVNPSEGAQIIAFPVRT